MSKVRVYELARELGLENRELVSRISALGLQVRNHMSALEGAEAERIRRAVAKEQSGKLVEEKIRPTVVRRRSVARKEPKPQEAAHARETAAEAQASGASTEASPSTATTEGTGPAPAAAAASSAPSTDERRAASAPVDASETPAAAARGSESPSPQTATQAARSFRRAPTGSRSEAEAPPEVPASNEPAPASVRLAHANLPPGVVARGKKVAPAAPPLSRTAVSRIVSEHGPSSRPGLGDTARPRRRELGRAALGQGNRSQQMRPARRKQAPTKKGQKTEITTPSAQKRVIRIEDQVGLQALAQKMSLKATDLLMKLMQLGMTNVNINSTLDTDTAQIIASEFNYEVENVAKSDEELIGEARGEYQDKEDDRDARPPVVTVMGHVDHGKTSLLDAIRSAEVANSEAGGITQHIGAYRVETKNAPVVFLDTPGHEAFTAMRARGAKSTDVVVLVVAADDGVMPQTKEAVNHARAAKVPIVVAVNKVDKPDAKPEVVKRELASEGLQPEEWGGDTIFIEVSAHTKQGLDKLVEAVLLQSEILELKANPKIPAEGVVLEAYLDRGRGAVANVLVQDGTLSTGDHIVAGSAWGKVRAMRDDKGKPSSSVTPSTPVEILGLSDLPSAGERFYVVKGAKKAQEIAESRRKQPANVAKGVTGLDKLYEMMREGEVRELKLVVKADAQGSVEALTKAFTDIEIEKVKVTVIHQGVGGITENDVMLASASQAIIIGFNVRPAGNAASTAKSEGVDVRAYSVIYEAIDDVKKAMAGLLEPEYREKPLGAAEVRQTFQIPKVGMVAGCYITEGKLVRNGKARLVRDSVQVWEGDILALRRFKDDVREVTTGYECGLSLQGFNDIKEKDVIECFELEEIERQI